MSETILCRDNIQFKDVEIVDQDSFAMVIKDGEDIYRLVKSNIIWIKNAKENIV